MKKTAPAEEPDEQDVNWQIARSIKECPAACPGCVPSCYALPALPCPAMPFPQPFPAFLGFALACPALARLTSPQCFAMLCPSCPFRLHNATIICLHAYIVHSVAYTYAFGLYCLVHRSSLALGACAIMNAVSNDSAENQTSSK